MSYELSPVSDILFSFEDLEVWQKSVDFAKRIIDLSERIKTDHKHLRLIEQLEASSASIAQNIAEGKGHYTKKDFVQYLYVARGFLYKTVTLVTIFHKNRWISEDQVKEIKRSADEIAKMLSGLITSVRQSVV